MWKCGLDLWIMPIVSSGSAVWNSLPKKSIFSSYLKTPCLAQCSRPCSHRLHEPTQKAHSPTRSPFGMVRSSHSVEPAEPDFKNLISLGSFGLHAPRLPQQCDPRVPTRQHTLATHAWDA
jgi:hypothetical protein